MSKLGANIFLIATTNGPKQLAEMGLVKVDYFDFPNEIFEKLV